MKNIVIIKVFRNDITCNDYHDINLNNFDLKLKELRSFADSIGKQIYFTVCKALNCADFDCFAEITYNGTLSEQEKEKYESIVKYFAQDADIENGELKVYNLPVSIIYSKVQM